MPKVTSLAAHNSNKEIVRPSTRVTKSSVAATVTRDSEDEDMQMSQLKKPKSSSSLRRAQHEKEHRINGSAPITGNEKQHASPSVDSYSTNGRIMDVESEREDKRKGRREQILEERIALLTKEKDQVQGQFDELRELRQSEPERLLAEWRKASDRRDAQAEEYVSKLKSQIKVLEQNSKRDAMSSSSDGAFLRSTGREEVDEWSSRERKLKDEVNKLKQDLAAANLAARGGRVQSSIATSMSTIGTSDEKAIRRLYEDLTGLFISKVEPAMRREKEHYRCFHATFASEGYYNLEMKLEESESNLPSTDLHPDRQDLVYVPAMNPDRDAEIIASGKLPSYLTESLRFERSTAVRFMSTLHKRLDKSAKR